VQKSEQTVNKEISNTQVQHRENQSKVAYNMQGREEYQLKYIKHVCSFGELGW